MILFKADWKGKVAILYNGEMYNDNFYFAYYER